MKTFKEYEEITLPLAKYPDIGDNYVYPTLGLTGESGEFADKIKKIIRDKGGIISSEDRVALLKELGDVLWYITACAMELDSTLEKVAALNIIKLLDRNKRNVINGEGDDR